MPLRHLKQLLWILGIYDISFRIASQCGAIHRIEDESRKERNSPSSSLEAVFVMSDLHMAAFAVDSIARGVAKTTY